jgi:hypothetical protein
MAQRSSRRAPRLAASHVHDGAGGSAADPAATPASPRQHADQVIDIVERIVDRWGDAQAAGLEGDADNRGFQTVRKAILAMSWAFVSPSVTPPMAGLPGVHRREGVKNRPVSALAHSAFDVQILCVDCQESSRWS